MSNWVNRTCTKFLIVTECQILFNSSFLMNLINKYLYPTEPYMARALNDILWHHLAATVTIFVGPHPSIRDGVLRSGMLLYLHLILK